MQRLGKKLHSKTGKYEDKGEAQSVFPDGDDVLDAFCFEEVRELLSHKADGFLMIFGIFCIEELIEGEHKGTAAGIIFLMDTGNTLSQPCIEFSDFHIVSEVDAADVVDALESFSASLELSN